MYLGKYKQRQLFTIITVTTTTTSTVTESLLGNLTFKNYYGWRKSYNIKCGWNQVSECIFDKEKKMF